MSKRTYLSGSEKRKRLAIQKENISKLPKLTSFFTLEETNRQTEFSTSLYQGTSNFESLEIGPTLKNDTTSVLSSLAPNLTTAVSTSEFKTSSLSNCDLTNTHIIENISHDPGTYCDDILTKEKHDTWILEGPEFFQNKNSDFSETFTSISDVSGKTKSRSLTRNVMKNGNFYSKPDFDEFELIFWCNSKMSFRRYLKLSPNV